MIALTAASLLCASPVAAQVCAGFASLDSTRFRVAAGVAGYTYADAIGGSITAGRRVYGTLSVGRTYDDAVAASSYEAGLELGADLRGAGGFFLCPTATLSYSHVPYGYLLYDNLGYRRVSGALGVGAAGVAARFRSVAVQPTASLRVVRLIAWELLREFDRSTSDTYWQFGAAIGLVVNDVVTIRPGLTIPFNLVPPERPDDYAVPFGRENGEFSFGIEVGVNFGRRTPREPR